MCSSVLIQQSRRTPLIKNQSREIYVRTLAAPPEVQASQMNESQAAYWVNFRHYTAYKTHPYPNLEDFILSHNNQLKFDMKNLLILLC